MRKIFTKEKEVKIGLSVLIALVVLFFGINFLKGVNVFKAVNYYYATFHNVNGLAKSSPVTLNGFKVGQVRDMEYDYAHPGNILVEISLDKDLKIPAGTEAVLGSDILGTASIELRLGSGGDMHEIGDTLIAKYNPGMLESLGGELVPSVSQIFPKIDTLLTTVNALVANPALQTSISRIDGITADLQTATSQLALMTKQLAPLPGQISPILSDVKGITGNVNTITQDVTQFSSRLKEMPLDSLVCNLKETTDNLRMLSEQLNDPNSTLGQLMNNPALYENINHTVASLDSLFIDIKKNPKRYVTVKVF